MARQQDPLLCRWDRVNGYSMHARVTAMAGAEKRPAFVLVHGVSMSSRYLLPTAAYLAADYAVYVPDMPGFGVSEKPSRVLSTIELAETLANWMDAADIERAAMLGNSYGCQIILELALRYPERVTGAVLVGLTPDPRARSVVQMLWRGMLDILIEPVSILPILVRDYFRAGFRRTIRTLRNSLKDPVEQKLSRVQVPVLVVAGSRDTIAPPRWLEQAARLPPHGQLAVLRGAGHGANFSAPQELAWLARSFVGSYSDPPVQTADRDP